MALIKCSECGKEISDKAKECVHCGIKLNKKKKNTNKEKIKKIILTILNIIIFIITFILCLLLLLNLGSDALYTYGCNMPDTSFYNIVSIIIFILILLQLFIMIKGLKIKSHIILKIISIFSIVIGITSISIYIFNYFEAKKYDFNISIKTIVKDGNYNIENAKNIERQIDEIIYPYSCYSMPITNIYSINNEEQRFIFNEDALGEEKHFSLVLKINDNKIENMYWNFNDNTSIYLYDNYQKTTKSLYYAKVLERYSGNEDCISCNYLKSQISDSVKSKLHLSSYDIIYLKSLHYDKDSDMFYYEITTNSENKKIKAYLKDKNNHELDYTIIVE